jgi:methionine biosynthesis protein MetW
MHRHYRQITRPAPLEEFHDYDQYWEARVRDGRQEPILDRYRTIAKLLPTNASVLDIGCGDGAFLRYLRTCRKDCRLAGADISSVAIEELRASGITAWPINKTTPLQEQLSGFWDVVVLMEVIEHVPDAEELIREVLGLRPSRIFVTIPNVGFLPYRLRLMFAGRFPITSIFYHMKEHLRFWTVKDFLEWAPSVGTTVVSYHGQVDRGDSLARWMGRRFPSLFSDRMIYELSVNGVDGA